MYSKDDPKPGPTTEGPAEAGPVEEEAHVIVCEGDVCLNQIIEFLSLETEMYTDPAPVAAVVEEKKEEKKEEKPAAATTDDKPAAATTDDKPAAATTTTTTTTTSKPAPTRETGLTQ